MTDEQTQSRPPRQLERFEPVAALLAVIFPGAGHLFLREYKRGVMVGVGVLGLFFGGMFIGGIDVIDSREDRLWFVGQALVGPIALGVNAVHQSRKVADRASPTGTRTPRPYEQAAFNEKSIAKMNELGTLFATIAGMLNLIAVLDAAFHSRPREGGS